MHIMLVADRPSEAARLNEWLCTGLGDGCDVTILDSLNEALFQMQANPQTVIDVLIVDLIIPPNDAQLAGLTLAQARAPHMGIIAVSDIAPADIVRTAIRSGAQEFWVKSGLDAHRLADIITTLVADRQRLSEGLQRLRNPTVNVAQAAIILCELSPVAVARLARLSIQWKLGSQATLEKIIQSFSPPDTPGGP